MKKLSIITCTYNSERYLQECLDSVKAQKLDRNQFEHIFVDGNSTDKTKEIIEKYMEETGFQIYIYEQNPKGVYAAMNYGAIKAEGEYLMWLNSDDWLESNIMSQYINYIDSTGKKDLYYGNLRIHRDGVDWVNEINKLKILMFKVLGLNKVIGHPTVLMKKDVFLNLGMFDETKKIASDNGMWLALFECGGTIKYFPRVVANFRMHNGSLSTVNARLGEKEVDYFRRKYLSLYKYCLGYGFICILKVCDLIKKTFKIIRDGIKASL